jgi:3-phosphoshikimate 1-carboxyvinyltransferase
MQQIKLSYQRTTPIVAPTHIPSAKSLHNRWLVLQHLYFPSLQILNPSKANDSRLLLELFQKIKKGESNLNAEDAGTTFRFLTAFLATQKGSFILNGSERMKERPIKGLVDMLKQLGVSISYLEKQGYPPLQIEGKDRLSQKKIEAQAHESSQFLSAMAMIAPSIKGGLRFVLPDKIASRSYFEMTLQCMQTLGLHGEWSLNRKELFVKAFDPSKECIVSKIEVEKDWSSASFWILLPLLLPDLEVRLPHLSRHSQQPDALFLLQNAKALGIEISASEEGVIVRHKGNTSAGLTIDFSLAPDCSINTIAVLSAAKIQANCKGLSTLRYKETDRIKALQNELSKTGAHLIETGDDNYELRYSQETEPLSTLSFDTYLDHRMAMAFSYFAIQREIIIENPDVVKKSYPDFWVDVSTLFQIKHP